MMHNDKEFGVAITGMGLHGALGDVEETWRAVLDERTALAMCQPQGVSGVSPIPAAPVEEAAPLEFLRDRKQLKYMNQATAMAVTAAGRALRDADLLHDVERREGLGLFVATGLIAFELAAVGEVVAVSTTQDGRLDLTLLGQEGLRKCHPLMPFKMLLNMPLGMISICLGIKGANFILYPSVAQMGVCLESAIRAVRSGRLERVLVGGVTHAMSMLPLFTLKRQGRLAESIDAAFPFQDTHAGYAPADMAAFLVLENERAARERKAGIHARITAALAANSLSPDRGARYRTRARLWADACEGQLPDRVLSTGNLNWEDDREEVKALDRLWNTASKRLSSLDGWLGYAGAASLPCAVAMASRMISRGEVDRVLVSAGDPDGGHAAVGLCGTEEEP